MLKKIFAAAFLAGMMTVAAAESKELPLPQKSGGMSVREALSTRHSVRSFKDQALTSQQLADMLWSANGINRKNGKRTAPSAMDRREVMIFVALPDGVWYYDPALHLQKKRMERRSSQDLRKYCGKFEAPCYFILVPDRSRQKREVFAALDVGYVSQNIYLAAQANGLGTCAMGSIVDRKKLTDELKLGKNVPILVHPVGIPR